MSNWVATLLAILAKLAIAAKSILAASAVLVILVLLALSFGGLPLTPSPTSTLGEGASALTVTGSTWPAERERVAATIITGMIYLPIIQKSDISGRATSTPTLGIDIFTLNVTPGSPAQVTGLSGSTQLDAGITRLTWSPNPPDDDVLGYRVYRSSVEVVSFRLLAEVPADVISYTDDTATCGQMYFITAYNAEGESPPSTASYFSLPCR